ncbi:UDP-N-acetylglucosamine--N-acetylmuramyl-(pentapeptide) pyrophosphoryl-undecaprenol N-acetylglucosamine transferase [Candidatus Dojkabacteria bacterium]|uniref:UDP-N-acetylglucosamine--N-acetylmuramyl-(pentapeptide) pyrophosphoryl-undecaprenol N-acetylglucosamine transferase n=1 Tax=Candidatus Dojkabacteria bacterium TaxID=2099670 RepID=A0A955IA87_9BACT|nr:UDP-N-acetylglucosamine--N-acetylmuramyl-(pentapeptide) pyrophosphoryl-undecaprenol N-acetylglucosamine transferase [Candidatus Dojkabacteria bacterium]
MNKKKILITGGHATPAFAVLDELLNEENYEFIWVGEKHNQRGNKNASAEFLTVTENYKLKFIEFNSGKLLRAKDLASFIKFFYELFLLIKGFIGGFFVILSVRPKLILTFGGFNAVPIAFWGRVFGKKVVTHEQTVVSGMANRLIAKFANKILVSWEDSLKFFPENKTILTGNPIRKDIFEIKSNLLHDFDKSKPTIYITGGNQGAHEINKRVFEIVEKLLDSVNIVHQTGNSTITDDFQKASNLRESLSEEKRNHYIVKDYISSEEIGEVLNKSDLLISRAGANTVAEILALGKLAILIPIPWASGGEQDKNANYLVSIGLAKKLIQSNNLTSHDIESSINQSIHLINEGRAFNDQELFEVKLKAKEKINLNASQDIAKVIKDILN